MDLLSKRSTSLLIIGAVASVAVALAVGYRYYTNRLGGSGRAGGRDTKKYFTLPKHVQVHVVEREEDVVEPVQCLLKDMKAMVQSVGGVKVIGLDAEWTTKNTMNSLALLQLSTENNCLLLRLSKMKVIPASIVNLLEDDQIIKAGVAVANDTKMIYSEYGVLTKGCVDLQPLAHNYGLTDKGYGLKALAKTVLNVKLNKKHHLRCGNWAAPDLSQGQIEYGALDAWVGYKIFSEIYQRYGPKDVDINDFCREISDIILSKSISKKVKVEKFEVGEKEGLPKYFKVSKRKSALYENCVMLAPDGEQLCSINRKKVKWYLDRELADIVQEEPNIVIKLRMDPKGRGHAGSEYYLAKKENRCVVCNTDESFVRFYIVPSAYRKFMPLKVKDHSSHDIVLLCQQCHRKASIHNETLRKKLKIEYKVDKLTPTTWKIDNNLKQVKVAAITLQKNNKLPPERREELLTVLKKHFNKEQLEEEDYKIASSLEYKMKPESDESHEKFIVESLQTDSDLELFIFRWRKNFIDTMRPQFMPTGWQLDHPIFERK